MHYYLAMARTDPQLNLRLPADLKDMLEEAAKANNRTLTSETVDRLIASFEQRVSPNEIAFLLSRMEMRATDAELDLAQMKVMLAEVYWALQAARMFVELPVDRMKSELASRIAEWDETLEDVKKYLGDPTDVESISQDVNARLDAFTNALDKTKVDYSKLKKSKLD